MTGVTEKNSRSKKISSMNFPTREPGNWGTGVSGTFLFTLNFGKKPVICLYPPIDAKRVMTKLLRLLISGSLVPR